jgi:hypothetical protein
MPILTREDWEELDKMGDLANPREIARMVGRRLFHRLDEILWNYQDGHWRHAKKYRMVDDDEYQALKREWMTRP